MDLVSSKELFGKDNSDNSSDENDSSNKDNASESLEIRGDELRCIFGHFKAVTGLKIYDRESDMGYNLLLSASEDFSVRVWALSCSDVSSDSILLLQFLDIN